MAGTAIEACAVVETFGVALPELIRKLNAALRSTSSHVLTLLTVHQAKGAEWQHVFVHTDLRRVHTDLGATIIRGLIVLHSPNLASAIRAHAVAMRAAPVSSHCMIYSLKVVQ